MLLRIPRRGGQRSDEARLLLLSKFLKPRRVEEYAASTAWRAALQEDPVRVIRQLRNEGMLIEGDMAARLQCVSTLADLREMCRRAGLPVSGRKANLVERIIGSDPASARSATSAVVVFQCTERGRVAAAKYLDNAKSKRDDAERQVFFLLRQRRFREASVLVAAYESAQVFPRGIGIDWSEHDPAEDVALLRIIFERTPRILSGLVERHSEELRVAAGMMQLWSLTLIDKWLPSDMETGLRFCNSTAARMLVFHALHVLQLAQYRGIGAGKRYRILSSSDPCPTCKRIAGRTFAVNEYFELPYEHCTDEMGCRCSIAAVF